MNLSALYMLEIAYTVLCFFQFYRNVLIKIFSSKFSLPQVYWGTLQSYEIINLQYECTFAAHIHDISSGSRMVQHLVSLWGSKKTAICSLTSSATKIIGFSNHKSRRTIHICVQLLSQNVEDFIFATEIFTSVKLVQSFPQRSKVLC